MTAPKHTPGPWESLLSTLPEAERYGLTLEDARRADAGPELLEALERIAEWTCDCDEPEEGEEGTIVCQGCIARAAIAKAKGEA